MEVSDQEKDSVENKIQWKKANTQHFDIHMYSRKMRDHFNKNPSPFAITSKAQALLPFGRSQREYGLILSTSLVWKLMFLDKTHSGNCEE